MWAQIQLKEYMDQTTRQRSHSRSVIFALPHETVFSLVALLNPRLPQCHCGWEKEPKAIPGLTVTSAATCTCAICQDWAEGWSRGPEKEGGGPCTGVRASTAGTIYLEGCLGGRGWVGSGSDLLHLTV